MGKNKNLVIITNPMIAANKSAEVTISKFIRVMNSNYQDVTVVGGNLSVEDDLEKISLVSYDIKRNKNKIRRVLDVIMLQLKISWYVLLNVNKKQDVYFWIADKMILPFLAAKFKHVEINYFIYGNVAKEGKNSCFTKVSSLLIKYMAEHATYTCMESKSVIKEWPELKIRKTRMIHLYTDEIQMNPIKARTKTFGMICRLTEGKHVVECINAMINIHQEYPDWKLEIIGSGKQEIYCRELISQNHANDYITLHGWIEHNQIIEKSKLWRFFLFPTDTEGMPNSLIEMMGRGIPSIASPVGGINDVITDCYNGKLLKGTNVDIISKNMIEMIEFGEKEYVNFSERTYEFIKNEYSLAGAKRNAREEVKK